VSTSSASGACADASPGRAARALILGVEAYRLLLSPLIGGYCRFVPSCSVYAQDALARHGARRGLRLALLRLARCHPLHPGGIDPVP